MDKYLSEAIQETRTVASGIGRTLDICRFDWTFGVDGKKAMGTGC